MGMLACDSDGNDDDAVGTGGVGRAGRGKLFASLSISNPKTNL